MSYFEIKSLKIILILLIFNTICIGIYFYLSFLKATFQPNYADDFMLISYLYSHLVYMPSLHYLHIVCQIRFPFVYRKRMAYLSIFLPYVVIFLNLDVIGSYEYSY